MLRQQRCKFTLRRPNSHLLGDPKPAQLRGERPYFC